MLLPIPKYVIDQQSNLIIIHVVHNLQYMVQDDYILFPLNNANYIRPTQNHRGAVQHNQHPVGFNLIRRQQQQLQTLLKYHRLLVIMVTMS